MNSLVTRGTRALLLRSIKWFGQLRSRRDRLYYGKAKHRLTLLKSTARGVYMN